MKNKLKILNGKEIKKIKQILEKQFNYSLKKDYAYLENNKGKIYLVNKDISRIDLDNLRTDRFGIYFAERKNEWLRLSTEGAQLFALEAKKGKQDLTNVIELDKIELEQYYQGSDLIKEEFKENNNFVLLSYKKEIFSCAKVKDGKLLNYLPKIYRGTVIV